MGDVVMDAFRRGVWTWCFCSAASAAPVPFNLAAVPATVAGVLSLTPRDGGRRHLSFGLSIGFGLGLYGTSRFFLPSRHPLSIVLVTFAGAQAYSLSIMLYDKLGMSSKFLWIKSSFIERLSASIWNWTVASPPSKHPLVRYPLLVTGYTLGAMKITAAMVLWTFMDVQRVVLPPFRMKLRSWRLELRRWPASSSFIGSTPKSTHRHHYKPLCRVAESLSVEIKPRIRLLKLLPRLPFGRINCELLDVAVRETHEYEAISYTWGAGELTGLIFIDGKPVSVSPTIEDLLYHLSSYSRSRLLWIDQICINQADNDEKMSQIPMMRDIYRDATNTIIWLDDVEEPWKARMMLAGVWHEHMYGTTESTLELMRSHADETPLMGWAALMNVFAHPWFFRVWVIQEIILSPSATVLASGEPIQWSHLEFFAQLMANSPYNALTRSSASYGIKDDAVNGLGNAAIMAILRSTFWESPDYTIGQSLEFLLGLFANFQSTLPVDRIYAIFALLPGDYLLAAPWLQPDYSKLPDEVFTAVATHLLQSNCNQILSYAGRGYDRNLTNLPSWVPDWTSVSMKDTLRQHFTKISHSSRYNASLYIPLIHYFPSPGILSITGHIFDSVLHLSPTHTYTAHNKGEGALTPQEMSSVMKPHFTSRRMVSQHIADPYPATGQPRDEAFWRTLVGDTEFSRPADPQIGEGCGLWERLMLDQCRGDPDTEREFSEEMENVLTEDEVKARGREAMMMVMRQVFLWNSNRIMCCTGRRFCVTEKGFMAMVPPGTREGDLLVVLYGLNTPFVVREMEESERVRIMGEAYVHGMMDGEAFGQLVGEVRMFEVE